MKIIIVDNEEERLTKLIEDENTSDSAKEYYNILLSYIKANTIEVKSIQK